MPDDDTVLEAEDVFGDSIRLTRERWDQHILATHPEVKPYLSELKQTLKEPHCVYRSAIDPESKLFYRRGFDQGRYSNLYLKIVVSYKSEPADIKTVFLTSLLTGGELLWIKYP